MPLAKAIKRRLFNRRYVYVGRAMLPELADIYEISIETARAWADACDADEDPNSDTLLQRAGG